MTRPVQRALVHGALGGLLAGLVVALWFLAVDVAAGQPLETPARLGSAVLGREYAGPTLAIVGGYTVLHFGVFLILGAVTGWFLEVTAFNPGPLVGLVWGLGGLTGLHYAALMVAGVDELALLPAGHVLGANLAAGLLFMVYLGRAAAAGRPFGLEALGSPLLTRGIVTGLVGAVAVALWFLVLDALAGRPFFTPAALGSALLGAAAGAGEVEATAGVVTFYTVVHLAAFSVAGLLFVLAAEQIERTPWFWFMALLFFVVLEAVFVPVAGLLGAWAMGSLAWWAVGVGNLVAVAAMGWWTWRTHPGLRDRLAGEVAPSG